MEGFDMYAFTCVSCSFEQYISYCQKSGNDPDRHACPSCDTVFWWSFSQKKLYVESTQAEVPEEYMKKV